MSSGIGLGTTSHSMLTPTDDNQTQRQSGGSPKLSESFINVLPPELLSIILLYSIVHENPWQHYRNLHPLQLVCRQWTEVIDTTPRLWYYNNVLFPPDVVRRILHKSGELPVTFSEWSNGSHPENSKERSESFNVMSEHMKRVKSIYLAVERGNLSALTSHPAPMLEQASLYASYASITSGSIDLFQSYAPNLKSLTMESLPVNWTSPIFSGLQVLSIDQGRMDHGRLQGPQVLRILSNCPDLRKLSLRGSSTLPLTASDSASYGSNSVVLPKLEMLEIRTATSSYFPLLERIIASSLTDTSITYYDDGNACPNLVRIYSLYLEGLAKLTLNLKPNDTSFVAEREHDDGATGTVEITQQNGWPYNMLQSLATAFNQRCVPIPSHTTLCLLQGILHHAHNPSTFLRSCTDLPNLTAIKFDNYVRSEQSLPTLLEFLGTPLNDPLSWPFPQLEMLNLVSVGFGGSLVVNLVRIRYGHSRDGPSPPVILEKLVVPSEFLTIEEKEEIETLLGVNAIIEE